MKNYPSHFDAVVDLGLDSRKCDSRGFLLNYTPLWWKIHRHIKILLPHNNTVIRQGEDLGPSSTKEVLSNRAASSKSRSALPFTETAFSFVIAQVTLSISPAPYKLCDPEPGTQL